MKSNAEINIDRGTLSIFYGTYPTLGAKSEIDRLSLYIEKERCLASNTETSP
jgi:hypothetical protein